MAPRCSYHCSSWLGAAPKPGQPTVWIRPSSTRNSEVAVLDVLRKDVRASGMERGCGAVSAGDSLSISLAEPRGSTCVEVAASSTASNDWATLKFLVELPR